MTTENPTPQDKLRRYYASLPDVRGISDTSRRRVKTTELVRLSRLSALYALEAAEITDSARAAITELLRAEELLGIDKEHPDPFYDLLGLTSQSQSLGVYSPIKETRMGIERYIDSRRASTVERMRESARSMLRVVKSATVVDRINDSRRMAEEIEREREKHREQFLERYEEPLDDSLAK